MEVNTTDLDNLFVKDETFPKEVQKWTIIFDNGRDQEVTTNVLKKTRQYHIGFYLIRDLLNMKKLTTHSSVFIFDNIQVGKVIICGKIISVERRNQHYRLVINDGTSSMLCVWKIDQGLKDCSQSILGRTVKVIGYLKEYMETNFIFAHHISWISQQGYVDFMEYVIDLYRLRNNTLLDK
ncbi:hypothetical protein GWI33_022389 [Rhynchophorus ferrugineus]|uniref:CST complex subunit Stn1 N-terminal domain-containing protein n=1 Tax=Rhynchophorus ferrugineus TaxID=354439 RepID=A0A834ISG6_RHYFE|nr:hypothetical protein GWI33_022389 [Rhynchophorus ferrugineus]